MADAYPLQWPHGRPRAKARRTAQFGARHQNSQGWSEKRALTINEAISRLQLELDNIGAKLPVLSSNLEPRLDGFPRSGQREPADPGIAVYFQLAGKPHCLPCDTYDRAADNIAAIAAHIEATRKIERHGVASISEMFTGFAALPAPGTRRHWREVFNFGRSETITAAYLNERFRAKSKAAHPDSPGGSHEEMAELSAARDDALKELGQS